MNKAKYFLAIVIPPPFQNEIMELKKYVSTNFESKGALRSPAHITLHMPFEWKEEKESLLFEKLNTFKFNNPVSIELKNFSCFEPRVVFIDVLNNPLLIELQKKLVQNVKLNLNLFNQSNDMRGFHPHVTIAFRDLKKIKFNAAWDYFKTQNYSANISITSFHLLKHNEKNWEAYKEFNFVDTTFQTD